MKKILFVLMLSTIITHAAPESHSVQWTGSWAASPMPVPPMANQTPPNPAIPDTTYRDIVHLSLGGSALRLRISNEFGIAPLMLGGVHVALSNGEDAIQEATDHKVTFGGADAVTIPAGAMIVSDPVEMHVSAFANLAVSIFVPEQPGTTLTLHVFAASTNYTVAGNAISAQKLDGAKKVTSWYLLKGVDVDAGPGKFDVVTLGDSITDGAHSSMNKNARWTDILAERLQSNSKTAHIGVLNEGIAGNRILHNVTGPSALARLDRDVLAQGSAKYLVVLLGLNDIGRSSQPNAPDDPVTVHQVIWGLQQIAIRAHARGMKVYIATMTPFKGAFYQDAAGLKMREAVNEFIRSSIEFDAVIDFDMVTRDPVHPDTLLPSYDSGDHLHPGDMGYKAMGDATDLKLFQ